MVLNETGIHYMRNVFFFPRERRCSLKGKFCSVLPWRRESPDVICLKIIRDEWIGTSLRARAFKITRSPSVLIQLLLEEN